MRLKKVSGREIWVNPFKYKVKWDSPCRSKMQKFVKDFLRKYWNSHICVEEFPVLGTRLKCDFINFTKRIIIETNGKQHNEFNSFFHKDKFDFVKGMKRDMAKLEWATMNKLTLIEIFDEDLKQLSPEFFLDKFNITL